MPFRFGMLGMWHTHANGIVRQIAAHPREFSLVGFYDPDKIIRAARRRKWLPLLHDMPIFDSPQQLLREKLDGVIVEGKVSENIGLARMALEAGKPVMLEKPAGVNLGNYQRLIALGQKKKLHVQMIYLFRYMPAVQELFQRRKDLGGIYNFRARLPKPLSEYDRFVEELAEYKGGMFFEMAGHVIDIMVKLLGRPKHVTPFLAHHHGKGPGDYIDNGVAVFGFGNAWGIIEAPAMEVAPHARRVEVFGDRGACVIPHLGSGHLKNNDTQCLEFFTEGKRNWQRLELKNEPLQICDLREFVRVVKRRKKPDFNSEHDLTVQEMLLRASGMMEG